MIDTRYALGAAAPSIVLSIGLLLTGCGQEGSSQAIGGVDTTSGAVEGWVAPSEVEARIYLSRGGEIDSTVTRDGWYQLAGIDYGLYILEARAEGFGGERRLIWIDQSRVLVEPLYLQSHPWPIAQVSPRDSMVLLGNTAGDFVRIRFSRFMDRSSVARALRMEPACPFSMQWEDSFEDEAGDHLAVDIQAEDLEFGEPYALILDTMARTREGHALEKAFSLPVVRRFVIPGEGTTPVIAGGDVHPMDSIRIDFPQPVDMASVTDRIYLFPTTPYTPVWDTQAKSLRLVPVSRWASGENLTVGITLGYRSSTGRAGAAVSTRLYVHAFGLLSSRSDEDRGFENEHLTTFNMPVDFASLEFRMDPPATATPRQTAPDQILWSFRGGEAGRSHILRIESLQSRLGDDLTSPIGIVYSPSGPPANFRFLDSSQARDGLRPNGDTLEVELSRSAYLRLAAATFSLVPDFPLMTRLRGNPAGGGVLRAWSGQPWPAGTGFRLVPDTGAAPGDTLGFSTRFLEARILQPYQGQTAVDPAGNVELAWNTYIDTVDFAGNLRFEPPVDSLRVEQDTSGGGHRTRIRHAPFARATRYRLRVSGVVDLFDQAMRDTLDIRFQTRP